VTDAPLKNLSKGDLQKVGILQALAFAPALVVLDEPLEGLDESARSASLKLFAAAVAEGSALVVSFHGARNFAQVDQEFIVRGGVVERARTSNEHRIVLSSPDDRALPTPPQGFRVTRKNGKTIVTMPASETVAWVAHLHQSGWSIEGVLTSDVED